jgi:hypothetical protein
MAMGSLTQAHNIAGRMKKDKVTSITPEMIAYSALMVGLTSYHRLCLLAF